MDADVQDGRTTTLRDHVPALDGLRGIAILLVILFHAWLPIPGIFIIPDAGWMGVDIFFVLSGFLITGILLDAKGSPRFFRNFYARRALRILPLYYVVVLAMVIGGMVTTTQWWYWLHGVNILAGIEVLRLPPVHLWSLAVEEQFYLVWPLCVWALSREGFKRLAAGIVVGALLARGAMWAADYANLFLLNRQWLYTLTPFRTDSFAMGALVAVMLREPNGLATVRRAGGWVAAAGFAVIVLLADDHGLYWNVRMDVQVVGYTANAVLGAGLVMVCITRPPSFLSSPALRAFGKYSYALYMVHPFVMVALTARGFGPTNAWEGLAFFGAMTAASYAIAWLSWRLIESPMNGLKRFFEVGSREAAEDLPTTRSNSGVQAPADAYPVAKGSPVAP